MQARKGRGLVFEPPTQEEQAWIRQGLIHYMPEKEVDLFLQGKHLLVGRGRRNEVYLLSGALLKLYHTISRKRHPYFIGLFLGELDGETLDPSLHILQQLTAKAKEKAIVKVTNEGEQRFLYGHNLFSNHVQEPSSLTHIKGRTIIINQLGEGLGYCTIAMERTQKPVLKNRKDLGWYLRRGQ
ncbi:MAG: hypothetical protein ACFFDP_03130 [Promethearchaeota archaeon]